MTNQHCDNPRCIMHNTREEIAVTIAADLAREFQTTYPSARLINARGASGLPRMVAEALVKNWANESDQ